MHLTPEQIDRQPFRMRRRGYDIVQVREFLRQISEEMVARQRAREQLVRDGDSGAVAEHDASAAHAVAAASAEADEILATARSEADALISSAEDDARARADQVIAESQARLDALLAQERALQDQVAALRGQLGAEVPATNGEHVEADPIIDLTLADFMKEKLRAE